MKLEVKRAKYAQFEQKKLRLNGTTARNVFVVVVNVVASLKSSSWSPHNLHDGVPVAVVCFDSSSYFSMNAS